MRTSQTALLLVLGGPFAALGCSSSTADEPPVAEKQAAALRRAQSCDDLSQSLREDARKKMNQRIDAEVRASQEGYYLYRYGPGYPVAIGAENAAASPVADATTQAGAAKSADAPLSPAHSETETQVKGVDEADIVKADGTRIYVLHGQKFLMVNAWPPPDLNLAGGIDIEGTPSEMFVADGKAVVFSTIDGSPLYQAAGIARKPNYQDGYQPGGSGVALPAADIEFVGPRPNGSVTVPVTKVTVLALGGDTASVARELYFEGSYLSSRRVGSRVRVVLQGGGHGPALDYNPVVQLGSTTNDAAAKEARIQALEALRTKNEASIAATSYEDWVPVSFTKDGDTVQAQSTPCADFYIPGAGSTEFGMTQIAAFDLDEPSSPPRSLAIVGAADTVYGDATAMVLAARAYTNPWVLQRNYFMQYQTESVSSEPIPVEALNHTHLHLFDLATDPAQPLYVSSGTVPGEVPGQFAIDHRDGRVRVATNERRSGPALSQGKPNQTSHVFVLKDREESLEIEGDAGDIAPGETLYATRFVGDKAYIVTWHVVDPLFVIDLAEPSSPKILGQLKIPGFSEYMRPLDDNHLITIGRETDETGHQHTDDGYWYGVAIQIFDVTDPLKPALKHKYLYEGGDYATTEASQNHKAFTYFEDRKLLAFPYVSQSWNGLSGRPASTLEVFRIDIEKGIQRVGGVDHAPVLQTMPSGGFGYCGGYFDGSVRRGVFFEDVVYSISYGGVLATAVNNLAEPIASLQFSQPTMSGVSCR